MYEPKDYWQKRLTKNFNLRGVGYRRFSMGYNNWLYRRKRELIEDVLAGNSLQGKDVLDIGCGTGFFVQWYAQKGARVYGVDITDVSIQNLAKQFPDHEFAVADMGSEDYTPPRQFDIINMWDVIYHIVDDKKFERCMHNIGASAKPGALFLITDNFGDSQDRQVADHVRKRCLNTYKKIMNEAGFDLVELRPLFNRLNREISKFDNALAPIYYYLDKREEGIAEDNLSLAVWRFHEE